MIRISKFLLIASIVAATGFGAVIVLVTTDRVPVSTVQPPGCKQSDRDQPGCRVTRQRITTNTVALASAIVGPLATLAVALFAIGAGRRRQAELLATENARHTSRLEHEANVKATEFSATRDRDDLELLRAFLDKAALRVEDYLQSLTMCHVKLSTANMSAADDEQGLDEMIRMFSALTDDCLDKLRLANTVARQMDLRLPTGHPIRKSFWACVGYFDDSLAALPAFPPLTAEQESEWNAASGRAIRAFAVFATMSRAYIGVSRDDAEEEWATSNVDALLLSIAQNSGESLLAVDASEPD